MNKRVVQIKKISVINSTSLGKGDDFDVIQYLDTGNIIKNNIHNLQILKTGKDKIPSRAKRKVKKNTIIYSTVRPNQEHYGFLKNPDNNLIVSTGFTTIDIIDKNIDQKFIYYLITQKQITDYIHGIGINATSSYPSIKPEDIGNLKFEIPENVTDQKKISFILTTIDAKIELNNKINGELEKMAKTIYNYWFSQFDFPDENDKPYKSSGGGMVYNKELKRKIPKGWETNTLFKNSLTSILKPKIEMFEGEKEYLATANVNGREVTKGDIITYEKRESRANMQPIENSIWFAKMKASKKHLFVGVYSGDIIENNIFSTGFLGLKCEDFAFEYIASFISSDILEFTKDKISHGATMQGVGNNDLKFIKLVIPNKEVLTGYKKATEDIFKKIDLIRQENVKLIELRDWLLPMLMNGQIKVA